MNKIDMMHRNYPGKVKDNREQHTLIIDSEQTQEIAANKRTIPALLPIEVAVLQVAKGLSLGL